MLCLIELCVVIFLFKKRRSELSISMLRDLISGVSNSFGLKGT